MLKSMTGYGKAECLLGQDKYLVEIRSVNGKTADITFKTQLIPRDKEVEVRKYIADNIRYPDEPGCEDIEGVVYVQFRVDTLGNVSDVRLLRGLHPLFDAEAVRVVKTLPQFKPASLGNKPVSITHAVPVKFVKFNSNLNKKSNKNKSKITKK